MENSLVLSPGCSEPWTGPHSPEPIVRFKVWDISGLNQKSSPRFSKIWVEPDWTGLQHPYPTRPWLSSLVSVLRWVHPNTGISNKAMAILFGFIPQAGPPRYWYLQQGHGYPLWFQSSGRSTLILVSRTRAMAILFGFSPQAGPPWYCCLIWYPLWFQSSGGSTQILVSPTRPWLSSLVSVLRQVHPDTDISNKAMAILFGFSPQVGPP